MLTPIRLRVTKCADAANGGGENAAQGTTGIKGHTVELASTVGLVAVVLIVVVAAGYAVAEGSGEAAPAVAAEAQR